MASRAEGFESVFPESVKDRLRNDAARGIASAQKQNVKRFVIHGNLPLHVAGAGFNPRFEIAKLMRGSFITSTETCT